MIKRPILFEDITGSVTRDNFKNNGLGVLTDAISCEVTEELDGVFELNMRYPQSGLHFSELKARRIIYAKASDELGWQPFRIVRIGRALKGICTVYAQHYSYDLNGITVSPFTAEHVEDALDALKENAVPQNPFTFTTDKTTVAKMEIKVPKSVRNAIVGEEGSLLSTYKGDLLFDHSTVKLSGQRGKDRGFRIRYGKNLTGLNHDEDVQKLYTAIYPYYYAPPSEATGEDGEGEPEKYIELPDKIISDQSLDYGFTRVKVVDFSDHEEMMEDPNEEKLAQLATAYIEENDIGVHRISVTATFERLKKAAAAAGTVIEDTPVHLGDTVSVIYPALGTDVKARVVRMVFDSLLDRVKSVDIGEVKKRITDSFSSLENIVKEHETSFRGIQKTVARLNVFTTEDIATIQGMTEWKKGTDTAISKLQQTTSNQSSYIGLMVEVTKDENGEKVTKGKGEFFIKAINGDDGPESEALIRADKIAIEGETTFSSLFSEGKTTIDGGNITAGTLDVDEVVADGATIGGWTIAKDRLYKATEDSAAEMDSPCGMYSGSDLDGYYWDSMVTDGGKSPIRFYAGGSPVEKTCKFAVLEDGSVYLGAAISTNGSDTYVKINDGRFEAVSPFGGRSPFRIFFANATGNFAIESRAGFPGDDGKTYPVCDVRAPVLRLESQQSYGELIGTWHYAGGKILSVENLATALESFPAPINLSTADLANILRTLVS